MEIWRRPAGFWIRFIASLIDGIIVGVVTAILLAALFGLEESGGKSLMEFLLTSLYTISLLVYWNGQTIGKRVMNIRVKTLTGEPIGIGVACLRTLLAPLLYGASFGILLFVSGGMVIFRSDKRGLHDMIAGTQVVYED